MGDGRLGFFPPNSSSRFGYIQDIKVGKKTESFNILGYLLELLIKIWRFEFFLIFEIWRIWAIFSMQNPWYIGPNHIFQVEIWRNFVPPPKHCWQGSQALITINGDCRMWAVAFLQKCCYLQVTT